MEKRVDRTIVLTCKSLILSQLTFSTVEDGPSSRFGVKRSTIVERSLNLRYMALTLMPGITRWTVDFARSESQIVLTALTVLATMLLLHTTPYSSANRLHTGKIF